jgi:hypothetical protein
MDNKEEEVKAEEQPTSPKMKEINWILNENFTVEKDSAGNKVLKNEDYIQLEFKETLGKGRFCKVKKAIGGYPKFDEWNIPYAIKVFSK